jgi:hypothetical protein
LELREAGYGRKAMARSVLTPDLAAELAHVALGHVEREYPNKPDHVLAGSDDLRSPRALHPIFYGSYDWHSCVHSYWLLARLYRLSPGHATARDTYALFERALTPGKVEGEREYLARPEARGFERPYGWAWLLALQAELSLHASSEGEGWAMTLQPLARAFADRFRAWLPLADYPQRGGAHGNTAFALTLAADYAEAYRDLELHAALEAAALRWYGADRDCPAWEPSGDDFLSPTLVEAQCMRRLLDAEAFEAWLDGFLPRLGEAEPRALFRPAEVSDRSDGKIVHLDGLNLSRAWCFRSLARALPEPGRTVLEAAAARHLAAALPHIEGHYMGEHWLATFALLALTA